MYPFWVRPTPFSSYSGRSKCLVIRLYGWWFTCTYGWEQNIRKAKSHHRKKYQKSLSITSFGNLPKQGTPHHLIAFKCNFRYCHIGIKTEFASLVMPPTQLRPLLARGQIKQCKMDIWLENIYPKKSRHPMHSRNSLKFDIQVRIRLSKEVNGQPDYDLVICGTRKFSEKVYNNFHLEPTLLSWF